VSEIKDLLKELHDAVANAESQPSPKQDMADTLREHRDAPPRPRRDQPASGDEPDAADASCPALDELLAEATASGMKAGSQAAVLAVLRSSCPSGTAPTSPTMDDVDSMSGQEFEQLLVQLFSARGYQVERTKVTGDQGGDLILQKLRERVVLQAKRWSGPVGNSAVQEVVAAIKYYGCSRAMVVTNSTYTKSAVDLAAANGVELWDRARLVLELQNVSPAGPLDDDDVGLAERPLPRFDESESSD